MGRRTHSSTDISSRLFLTFETYMIAHLVQRSHFALENRPCRRALSLVLSAPKLTANLYYIFLSKSILKQIQYRFAVKSGTLSIYRGAMEPQTWPCKAEMIEV